MKLKILYFSLIFLLITSRSFGDTLKEVLDKNDIDYKNIHISHINEKITSYALLNKPNLFCIAYYIDNGSKSLVDRIYISLLKKDKNIWNHGFVDTKTLIPNRSCFHPGSIMRINNSNDHIYLDTHLNPSAGCILILSYDLKFKNILFGRLLAIFNDETLVYHNNQIHFAPTHYAEISIYNPYTKQDKNIYPIKPYQKIRLEHIKKVNEAYNNLGEDWFRNHNHHMNPELFNSSLKRDKIEISDRTNSLAFIIAYDNKDYFDNEIGFKTNNFRDIRRRLKKYEIKEPLPDLLFMSFYEDLMKIRRLKRQDDVMRLFENDEIIHKMLHKFYRSKRRKGENWKNFLISLDDNWDNIEIWEKIVKVIQVPPEYTEVAYIYRNIKESKEIIYKEFLLIDLEKRYGDIPLSEYLKPKLLNEIFKEGVD